MMAQGKKAKEPDVVFVGLASFNPLPLIRTQNSLGRTKKKKKKVYLARVRVVRVRGVSGFTECPRLVICSRAAANAVVSATICRLRAFVLLLASRLFYLLRNQTSTLNYACHTHAYIFACVSRSCFSFCNLLILWPSSLRLLFLLSRADRPVILYSDAECVTD